MEMNTKLKNLIAAILVAGYFIGAFAQTESTPKIFEKSLVPQDAFVFYVIGDWGRRGKYAQKDVAAAMDKCAGEFKPEFIVSTGDNFYVIGVKNVNDRLFKKSYEHIYTGKNIKNLDWYITLGNHDLYNPKGKQAQIDYSQKNKHWKLPAEYHAYSSTAKDGSKMDFLFLNTNSFSAESAQWHWIDSSLQHSTAKWRILFGHHPVYSSNPMHGDNNSMIRNLKPLLEKHDVQAYFCGHDHDLQHQQPEGSKVDYFVSGAGSKVRPTGASATTKFAQGSPGFAIAALSENKMQVWFINKDAQVIYSYERQID